MIFSTSVLLIELGSLSPERIRRAVEATFDRRATHPIPDDLLPPPKDWARPFAALLTECGLDQTLDGTYERIREVWAAVRGL
ncbi:MAG: hypothetical protein MZW92_53600 [Comamonadaceae bacterium]|nr:hypothetical protein [Comamonadaceae bacterium]